MPRVDLEAGLEPLSLQLNLDADSDFIYSLGLQISTTDNTRIAWPSTQILSWKFLFENNTPTQIWDSTLSADLMSQQWRVESAFVAELLAAEPSQVKLISTDTDTTPSTDLLWGFGTVVNVSG